MKPKESRDLRKQNKRLLIFLGVFFVFALVLCYLLSLTGISAVLNGFIIIVCAGLFYLIFLLVCAKIDKKRAEKREKDIKKDPFSRK